MDADFEIEVEPQIEKLARDILHLARNTLLVNLRFLDMAISQLHLQPTLDIPTLATDGQSFYYNSWHILSSFKHSEKNPHRDFLHVILHCLFHHAFVGQLLHQGCWDLACDIAVENAINDLGLDILNNTRQKKQAEFLGSLKSELPLITAEKLYCHFIDQNMNDDEIVNLRQHFYADDHSIWYQPVERQRASTGSGKTDNKMRGLQFSTGEGERQDRSRNDESTDAGGESQNPENNGNQPSQSQGTKDRQMNTTKPTMGEAMAHLQALQELWGQISQRAQVDLETISRKWGNQRGGLQQGLNEVTREKFDYADFLKRFSVMGEVMQVNDEEFDLVFYTYGLQLYENMPLIEPLEYKEVKRIKDFVIAIDTSGSVQGKLVQAFVQKTYNILMQTENFFRQINIHIIQCDADIQEHIKITTSEAFEKYIQSMKLRGFGGTDFRPVFSMVDQLIEEHEFNDLKGLIYFTDGYGTYPIREPDYDTAFVFLDEDNLDLPEVPYWAIKVVLKSEDLMEL